MTLDEYLMIWSDWVRESQCNGYPTTTPVGRMIRSGGQIIRGDIRSANRVQDNPDAEMMEGMIAELVRAHKDYGRAILTKYRYWVTNEDAARQLRVNVDTFRLRLNCGRTWLEGRLWDKLTKKTA